MDLERKSLKQQDQLKWYISQCQTVTIKQKYANLYMVIIDWTLFQSTNSQQLIDTVKELKPDSIINLKTL